MAKLGQHFLTDKNALKKIAALLGLRSGDMVVEIGPGHGELTEQILNNDGIKIIAIERDEYLAEALRKKFGQCNNVEIICGDALKLLPSVVQSSSSIAQDFKLAGNIPYYITGKLLRTISELAAKPEVSVFTIQKEVAERLSAKPPKMNRLAASVQLWANPEIAMIIPRTSFQPIPEVDSATVVLKKIDGGRTETGDYYKAVRAIFAQPRKTVLNNLASSLEITKKEVEAALQKTGIEPNSRPQNLSVKDIIKLASVFYAQK